MTVGELITVLESVRKEHGDDLPVVATWETTVRAIDGERIKVGELVSGPALVIDAEGPYGWVASYGWDSILEGRTR